MSEEVYTLKIIRTDGTEFQAIADKEPTDQFGKRMVSLLLLNIIERLDPAILQSGEKK